MMKYYSDKTREFYNTAEECQQAEFKAKEEENRAKILKERERGDILAAPFFTGDCLDRMK